MSNTLTTTSGSLDYNFSGSFPTSSISMPNVFTDPILPLPVTKTYPVSDYPLGNSLFPIGFDTYPQKNIGITISGSAWVPPGSMVVLQGEVYESNGTPASGYSILVSYIFGGTTQSFNESWNFNRNVLKPGQYLQFMGYSLGTSNTLQFDPSTYVHISSSIPPPSPEYTNVLEPGFTTKFKNTDCDVLQGEAVGLRYNKFIQDLDYSTTTTTPTNLSLIRQNTATRGTVPESNYTQKSFTDIRYNGSKIQSEKINEWTPSNNNIGLYGKTPAINNDNTLVTYCEWIGGTTPELTGKSAAKIKFIINEGDVIREPNLTEGAIRDIQNAFPSGENCIVSLTNPPQGTGVEMLNGTKGIIKGGYRVEPILYSQSSSLTKGDVYWTPFSVSGSSLAENPIDDQTALINHSGSDLSSGYGFPLDSAQLVTTSYEKVQFKPIVYDNGSNFTPSNYTFTIPQEAVDDGVYLEFSIIVQLAQTYGSSRIVNVTLHKNGTPCYHLPGADVQFDTGGGSGPSAIYGLAYLNVTIPSYQLVTGDVYDVRIKVDSLSNDDFWVVTNNDLQWTNYFSTPPTPNFFCNNLFFQDLNMLYEIAYNPNIYDPSFWRVSQNPILSGGTIAPGDNAIWGYPNYNGIDYSVITCSNDTLNQSYGKVKQNDIPNSGFNKIFNFFTVNRGDEFRFGDNEQNVSEVQATTPPYLHPSGTLEIKFKEPVASSSINLDEFLIRRYIEDGSFIIFDSDKPAAPSGPSIIKPQYVTTPLDKDAESFTLLLSNKGLITGE